jgi:hypothetical protein
VDEAKLPVIDPSLRPTDGFESAVYHHRKLLNGFGGYPPSCHYGATAKPPLQSSMRAFPTRTSNVQFGWGDFDGVGFFIREGRISTARL